MSQLDFENLDGRVVHSLWLLTNGEISEFLKAIEPSPEMLEQIEQFSAEQLNGLLMEVLRQWHLRHDAAT